MLIYETFALTFDTLVHLLPKKILSIYFGSLNIRCFKVFLTWYLYFDLTVQPPDPRADSVNHGAMSLAWLKSMKLKCTGSLPNFRNIEDNQLSELSSQLADRFASPALLLTGTIK